ncbi:MAG: hypothetical protein AMS21_12510 [Gemmatimonas sp. SG8_38_2]|nr:MAG: hypothetical protein AMS21_12510 [Gemmatimonas sp. SG8_38_2]
MRHERSRKEEGLAAVRLDLGRAQAIDDVERMDVPPEVRRAILGDVVFSAAAAFTIAADADPQLALLDLLVMTTLGRMVYEDYWPEKLGDATVPVLTAFEKLERDIWTVAAPIARNLQPSQICRFSVEKARFDAQETEDGRDLQLGQEHHRAGGADPDLG